jgi:hypothetical protein
VGEKTGFGVIDLYVLKRDPAPAAAGAAKER